MEGAILAAGADFGIDCGSGKIAGIITCKRAPAVLPGAYFSLDWVNYYGVLLGWFKPGRYPRQRCTLLGCIVMASYLIELIRAAAPNSLVPYLVGTPRLCKVLSYHGQLVGLV